MQKVLKFLERNVQWIALGLGVLYLMWAVYAYIFSTPVSVNIPSVAKTPLTPENVDKEINEQRGKALDLAMKQDRTIDLPKIDVLTPYLAKLDQQDVKVSEQVLAMWSGTRGGLIEGADIQGAAGNQVAQLPTLPPAKFVAESHDITSIQPAGAAPAAGGAAVQPVLAHQDVRWVSLKFKVPINDIRAEFTKAFQNVNVPRLFVTRFLQIEVLRQEQLPGGQWSDPPTPVKTIQAASMPQYPGDTIDPQDQNMRNMGFQYKDAVSKLERDFLNPAFPAVAPGAPPAYAPGQNAPPRVAKGAAPRVAAAPVPRPAAPAGAPVVNAAQGQNGQVATGEFDLTTGNLPDTEIVVHDLTAEDGKTYRYAIRYRLANPVWDSQNIASAAFSKLFALISPTSEWSKAIEIPMHTRIFVMNVNKPTSRVTFELFEWKDTGYHEKKLDAYPGDMVEKWTLVDIRNDRDSSVLVLDNGGKLDVHSKRTDSQDPSYQDLKAQAEQPVAAAGTALAK